MTSIALDLGIRRPDGTIQTRLYSSGVRAEIVRSGTALGAPLADIGPRLSSRFEQELSDAKNQTEELLGGNGRKILGRAKTDASAIEKLLMLAEDLGIPLERIDEAMTELKDPVGIRVILSKGNEREMNYVVKQLAKAVEAKELRILEVENYTGSGGISYLTDQQLGRLIDAAENAQQPPLVYGTDTEKKSGYTCVQMIVQFRNGAIGELQIRGPKVHIIAEPEHLAYALRRYAGKPIPNFYPLELQERIQHITSILLNLTKEQRNDYLDYLAHQYRRARLLEINGYERERPLPDSLSQYPELDMHELVKLHAEIEEATETARKEKEAEAKAAKSRVEAAKKKRKTKGRPQMAYLA
jgi:hypothetical protein